MSLKVYLPVLILAGAGVTIAVVDSRMRPVDAATLNPPATPTGSGNSGTKPVVPSGDPKGPEVKVPAAGAQPRGPVTPIANLDIAKLDVKISIAEALTLQQQGVTFIDGRKPEVFAAGHLDGALHISTDDVTAASKEWQSFYQSADFEAPVVVYCDGGDCHESEQLRAMMIQARFKQVFIMADGYPGWAAAGLPVVKGGG